ncbi:hypothetical protein ABIB82_007580 [Bradyrhizobium sp. i1.8.4]
MDVDEAVTIQHSDGAKLLSIAGLTVNRDLVARP